jgi:2-keto-3-deoxy-L-fuconate dehydrogenase
MADRLKGKTALITAAAQGIGRASALAFAAEGARVIATDLNEAKLAEIAGPHITTRKLDVLDAKAIAALPQETGPVDILFNCAGFVHQGTVLEATEEEWQFGMDLNVRSMFRLIRAYLPGMLAKKKRKKNPIKINKKGKKKIK